MLPKYMESENIVKNRILVKTKINDLKEEIRDLESKKNQCSALYFTIYISFFFWLLSGVSLTGNQIIWALILILFVWFISHLTLYKLKSYLYTYRTTKNKFTKYINLKQDVRNELHGSIDKLTPHVMKQVNQSLLMTIVMLICLTIITVLPFLNSDVTINIFNDYIWIIILLYVILIGKLIIVIQPNRSFNYFHKSETKVESMLSEDKLRSIASSWKVQKMTLFIFIFLGIIPSILGIGSIIYLIIKYWNFLDLPIEFFLVIIVVLIITIYVMQKYFRVLTNLSLGYEMRKQLNNLQNRIDNEEITEPDSIKEEFDNIMYSTLQSELKKL